MCLITVWGTRFLHAEEKLGLCAIMREARVTQRRIPHAATKILCAATETWYSHINNNIKKKKDRKGKETESLGLQEGSQWVSWSWYEVHTWFGSLEGKAWERLPSARYPSEKLSTFMGWSKIWACLFYQLHGLLNPFGALICQLAVSLFLFWTLSLVLESSNKDLFFRSASGFQLICRMWMASVFWV